MFVSTIVQMARIHQSLTPTQGLALINNKIEVTSEQAALATFKTKYYRSNSADFGKVGQGYWRGSRRRNDHMLV